jgi:hypothetical protein
MLRSLRSRLGALAATRLRMPLPAGGKKGVKDKGVQGFCAWAVPDRRAARSPAQPGGAPLARGAWASMRLR